ncbi:MAG: SpoIID/LytB domain-containing protein [Lachnospiraceae bacterium]|nr:SpoIID/LytB domain-containing protein [Lachnospiraceae bacterium]
MKKNRTFDKNQIVVLCLSLICVLLVFIIFFVSNHTISSVKHTPDGVTRAEVEEAYEFLDQSDAMQAALGDLSEMDVVTYGEYQQFLEQLHLWDVVELKAFSDWNDRKKEGVSLAVLLESRDEIRELFETMDAEPEPQIEESPIAETTPSIPQVDEHTNIRVLLLQGGEPLAKEIRFSANETYEISWKGKTKEKKKNQVIRAGQLKLAVGETAVIKSKKGEVYLADSQGNRDTLGYQGSFRITRYEGGYAVVNVVNIEDYLDGVVQSEMPAYFEEEALKAQAVCARTYIVKQLMQENYPQYEADVDDSVRFQAYNKSAPDERALEAVDATRGMILVESGLPINAYFFSTSHGVTSGREIWGLSELDYLQPVCGRPDVKLPDLSDEESFRTYIRESNAKDYDASSSYYRWKAALDVSAHLEEVKTLLRGIDEIRTDCVIIKDSAGQEVPIVVMDSWDEVQQLKVLERSASGAVLRLLIVFSDGSAELSNENYIRQVLGIWMETLQDKDGSFVKVGELLPSVYFYIQPVKEGIVLFGGGLGHGIGMSQYGANGLAAKGADMEEILDFYYQDVELQQLYSDYDENQD